jgi:DNA-binding response OmpR family regulator
LHLLQVGDKPFRRLGDGESLEQRGVHRTQVYSQQDAYTCLTTTPCDAIFIDLDHPACSGRALISRIRRAKIDLPIFAFTKIPDLRIKIEMLDLGADDVVTVLCPIDELLARVRAVLRRLERHLSSTMIFGPLQVMMDKREITVNGAPLRLSPNEYQLMELLVRKHGMPLSRETCLAYLYACKDQPGIKAIDILVFRLRKKLAALGADSILKNVWGHGFKLDIDPPAAPPPAGLGRRSIDRPLPNHVAEPEEV